MSRDERRNIILATLLCGVRSAALLCATGTLLQTFLNVLGFSENQIYIQSSLIQAANVLAILLSSRWGDTGNLIRKAALIQIPSAVMFLCYLPLCIWQEASVSAYVLLLAVSSIQSVLMGFYTVCDYKMPYCAYTEKNFGICLSATGIASSVATFGLGLVTTALTNRFPFVTIMTWGLVVSAALMLLAALLQGLMRPVSQPPEQTAAQEVKLPLKQILLSPVFRDMIPANLFRGFAMGAITVMPVMAMGMGYSEAVAVSMVSIQSAAMVAGSIAFGLMSRRMHPRGMILLGSLGVAAAGFMLIRGELLFLALYAIINFSKVIVDNAVPAALRWTVPAKIAGPYNAWRLIVHNSGTILGSLAAAWIPKEIVLLLAVGGQLLCGFSYYYANVMKHK